MSVRTPLSRVRHLGAAKEGVGHWWIQRLTAAGLVPLTLLLIGAVIVLARADYASARLFVSSPVISILILLFVIVGYWHLKLGMQVIIEDYVHHRMGKIALLALNGFVCFGFGLASVYAVVKLGFGVVAP